MRLLCWVQASTLRHATVPPRLTINTTNIPLGAEVIEVMVYRKRERRTYSPLTTDNTIFYVTGADALKRAAHATFDMFQAKRQIQTPGEPLRMMCLSRPLHTLSLR